MKFAVVAPDATVTEGGTVRGAALLESVTVAPPEPAALESVTVQADVAPLPNVVGLHDSWLTVVGAISEMNAV